MTIGKALIVGWKWISGTVYGLYVRSSALVERCIYDSDGYLYQLGTKITATAAQLNGTAPALASPVLTTPQINDTTADHQYVFAVNELAADRTVTLPLLTGNDEFVFKDHAQTLTGKTLTAPVLTEPAPVHTIGAHDYGAAAADWTLSAAELLKQFHKPTNANGAVNAIVATTIRPYCFINTTGQALTVKTAAGTGITIASTKSAWVMSDGTNVIRLTGDA